MKIKQLIDEHIGMIEDIFENDPNGDLGRVKRVAHYFSRKLIEAVGEEIIGEDDECRFDALSDPDTIIDKNDLREEQRIKLKEIINSIK